MNSFTIKAVVFDFGGVIHTWGTGDINQELADAINIPLHVFKEEYFKVNHRSNVQNIPREEMILEIVRHFTDEEKVQEDALSILRKYMSMTTTNTELLALIPIIRRRFKTAILSNATSDLRVTLQSLKIENLFDEIVISSEIGYQKPHKEAFDIVFKRLGVLPQETIFIDDSEKSLEKAEEIGYTAILFKNNTQLKKDLEKLGVL